MQEGMVIASEAQAEDMAVVPVEGTVFERQMIDFLEQRNIFFGPIREAEELAAAE